MTEPLLEDTGWSGKIYLSRWVTGGGGTAEVRDKSTGETIATVGLADPDDVATAAERANRAQGDWAKWSGYERARLLRRAADLFERHAEEIIVWLRREAGISSAGARAQPAWCAERLHSAAQLCTAPLGQLLAPTEDEMSLAQRVPMGVVAAITPWNGPLTLGIRALAPALALGNAVLLKPDTQTSVAGGAVIAEIFARAGLPADVLHVLPGGPEVGSALTVDPHVQMVSFTGSTETGRRVAEAAGRTLKRVSLELGGNNAVIVLDDADVDRAAAANGVGSFSHQGQVCMATGRHLVHRSLVDRYRDLLVAGAESLVVGDTAGDAVTFGPMISARHVDRVDDIVARTVAAGAQLVTGGRRSDPYYPPTVLAGVTPDMPAFTDEIFGPVAPLTVFDSEDEAVELANGTEFGLVASIQTRDPARGLRLARRMRTGMVHINDQTINDQHTAPLGGFGASGNGSRFGPQTYLDEYTQWQWVTLREQQKRYPG